MKHRFLMLATVMLACLGTVVAMAPSPAQAAAAATLGPFNFYLEQSPVLDYCLVTNGVGNPVTIAAADANTCANVTITTDGTDGIYTVYQFKNGNNNCIRANSSDQVKLASGPCSTTDQGGEWIATNGTVGHDAQNVRFENLLTHLWLKTNGYADGDNVLVGKGGENNWFLL
jgi:hypothetical protein